MDEIRRLAQSGPPDRDAVSSTTLSGGSPLVPMLRRWSHLLLADAYARAERGDTAGVGENFAAAMTLGKVHIENSGILSGAAGG